MTLSPDYLKHWAKWQSGPPAADPRGPHHHATQPDEDFVGLCDLSERVGMGVELEVSAATFGEEPYEYRNVVAVHVRSGDPEFDTRIGVTARTSARENLPSMARRARRALEAKL